MRVMAATYRDHVILCGLGSLGYRVLQQLVSAGVETVVLEKDEGGRFVAQAKALGAPVLARDMKEDQALVDAGVERARAIIICTNDDVANIEVALDSRRMNPSIRVVMRLFEQDVARKIAGALSIDAVFSASALAAPTVAAMSLGAKVPANVTIAGVPYLTSEVPVEADSALATKRVEEIEQAYGVRVLSVVGADGSAAMPREFQVAHAGERLIVHVRSSDLMKIAEAGKKR
jgi:Trk K+ transport system NAD-binding subunit